MVPGWLEGAGEGEGEREGGGDAKDLSPAVVVARYSEAVFLSVALFGLVERGSPAPRVDRDEGAVAAMVSMIASWSSGSDSDSGSGYMATMVKRMSWCLTRFCRSIFIPARGRAGARRWAFVDGA